MSISRETRVTVPRADIRPQYQPFIAELKERVAEVIDSGHFILGPNVQQFEQEAAAYLGVPETIGVASGTDALILSLDALGVGPGDEVICPAFTFIATALAIARRGATPVFCDVDPKTLNLDPADVERRVTSRTRAIIAVDLCGRPAPLSALDSDLPLIDDAAQAFGAKGVPDRRAISTTYSFFPSKNLFCLGDGGLVASADPDFADRVRMLRFYGSRDKESFEFEGYNSRLDEIHAAALRLFLTHLDEWNQQRRTAARRYEELGLGQVCQLPPDEVGHIYHLYVIRSPHRDQIAAALREAGVETTAHFTTPLHLQPVFRGLGYERGSLPETERAGRESLALPIWAGIDEGVQAQVVEAVVRAASAV
jgi:dTDP-4-amino-4,6-dideoxygalactose transaminase